MTVLGFARIEIRVPDVHLWAGCLTAAGFGRSAWTAAGQPACMLALGEARVLVRDSGPARGVPDLAGAAMTDVALVVDDVPGAFRRAVEAGAAPVTAPAAWLERRPGIVMACVSVGGRIRHTLCSTAACPTQAPGTVSRPRSGAGYVTLGVPSRDSVARFYAGALDFEDRGGGELRAGAAVLRLTDPCGKDGTGPASGSVRSVGFCEGRSVTVVPFCHLGCAHASASTVELPARPAPDEDWVWA